MKTDRFVKVMLVIIAGLLFLNCVKDVNIINSNSPTTSRNGSNQSPNSINNSTIPFIETSVEAAPAHTFFEVGKSYNCQGAGGAINPEFTVTKIDSNSGWIKLERGSEKYWYNTANIFTCRD